MSDMPSTDYFEFMGFPRELTLDADQVEGRYFELSRRYHPDFHASDDDAARQQSLERSSVLNQAYRTLKDSYERARYLLTLEWPDLPDDEKKKIPPALLMEVMEMQEKVAEVQHESDDDRRQQTIAELQEIELRLKGKMNGLGRELDEIADAWTKRDDDDATRQQILRRLNLMLNTRNYLRTLLATIDAAIHGGEAIRH